MDKRTEEAIRENLSYDPKSGKVTWKRTTSNRAVAGTEVGLHSAGYRRVRICKQHLFAHRIAWFLFYGEWPRGNIDHINGMRDDNRIENLRVVTQRENTCNQRIHREGRLPGCRKSRNRWRSQIRLPGGIRIHLGMFETEAEAYAEYMRARESMTA